ncbi:peptidase P60 [Pullulanibacillus camelliae]|uniref:Peptidase P60 n=1 Tax=Pullulanibacillus camelliae TaxID=1707096 RepID=A0A8J2YHM4_9BACL|nr:C40 family peptidase [Pullulanibacillus camelliae]GGE43177.1 peptidase P60 [Pullulanibacillus camelliae]
MGSKVNRKIAGLCVAGCLVLAAPLGASASTYSDLVNKKQSISQQKQTVQNDLDKVNKQIQELTEKISKKQIEIGQTKDEIDVLNKNIDKTKQRIQERQELFKKRLNTVYRQGDSSTSSLEVLFGSKDFGDFINRAIALYKLNSQDQQIIKKQKEDQELLKKQQDEVQDKLNTSESDLSDLQNLVDQIKDLQETKKDAMAALDKKEANLDDTIANVKAQMQAQKQAEEKAQEEAAQQSNNTQQSDSSSDSNSSSHHSSSVSHSSSQPQTLAYIPSSAASGSVSKLISVGNQFIGNSTYVWGAMNPGAHQFDCSGFVNWAYNQIGVNLGSRSTSGLKYVGNQVSSPQPGDLVFFLGNSHVGIYIGGGKFIGAQTSTGVAIESLTSGYWKNQVTQYRRVLN